MSLSSWCKIMQHVGAGQIGAPVVWYRERLLSDKDMCVRACDGDDEREKRICVRSEKGERGRGRRCAPNPKPAEVSGV